MAEGGEAAMAAAAAGSATMGPAENRTFFTGVDAEQPTKKRNPQRFPSLENTGAGPRIVEIHQDLKTLANSLDKRMADLLEEHEKDFFLAYKTHMYTVQREIKTLALKAEHEEAKTKEDTKIKALENELDRYMTEALRLDEFCKGYKKEVDRWKAKAEVLDEERRFLEDQIKGAKRQNKILRAAAERARSSAYSALMATKAQTQAIVPASSPGRAELALTTRPLSAGGHSAEGFRPAAGSGARRVMEARSRTPDARLALEAPPTSSPLATAHSGAGARGHPRALASTAHAASAVSLSSAGGGGGGSITPLAGRGSLLGNEAEERYVEAIQHLKESIIREQQNVRMLQATRASAYSRKSELEEFFLKCIDEARKELMRRKHLTMNKERSERERVLEAVLNNEDVLVCLYEKLFPHRTGIARSLGAETGGAHHEEPTMLAQLAA